MSAMTAAERAELRAMAHQIARCELAPRAARLDRGESDALSECWQVIADTGLDRALVRERQGGVGLDVADLLAIVAELALGDAGVAMCVLLCNAALAALNGEQLDSIGDGERWALIPVHPATEITACDGRLEGRVSCALGAYGADGLLLLLDGEPPTVKAVAADSQGLLVERDLTQMGLQAASAATLLFRGVEPMTDSYDSGSHEPGSHDGSYGPQRSSAPSAAGAPPSANEAGPALSASAVHALLQAGAGAIARGIATRAHELALQYAHDRRQGGVAIVEHDAVSDMLAAMAVRLQCWPEIAAPPLTRARALATKIAATDAAMASATDAVQVFGGTGYMVETGVEKLMRDAKYCQLFPEPNWVAQDQLMRVRRRSTC